MSFLSSQSSKCNYHFGSVTCHNLHLLDKGSVTQATNVITGVELPSRTGLIRTVNGIFSTGASASFTAAHPSINIDSIIFASIGSYNGTGIPNVRVSSFSAGSCTLTISNVSTTNTLNAPITIAYQIL
jgi:hypothetical protein